MEASAPWGVQIAPEESAKFGLIAKGTACLHVPGTLENATLNRGDFFLIAPLREFVLRDGPFTPAISPSSEWWEADPIRFGGGGALSTIIAGCFSFDKAGGQSLGDVLPPVIVIRAAQARTVALGSALDLLNAEAYNSAPGSQVVRGRLAEVVLIQAVRVHLSSAPAGDIGWLRGLMDPKIGAALRAMHEKIEHGWTVAALAAAAGMSRSAFAQRFKEVVNEGPMEHLTRSRMQRAGQLLRETDRKLSDIAQAVGYDSDAAFHKAFKRVTGTAPGEYRRAGGEQPRMALAS